MTGLGGVGAERPLTPREEALVNVLRELIAARAAVAHVAPGVLTADGSVWGL